MHSRWHRSRLFLFGLAGLVMLLVMWGAPPRAGVGMRFGYFRGTLELSKTPSFVGVRYIAFKPRSGSAAPPPFWRWEISRWGFAPVENFGPAFRYREWGSVYSVRIGIWFIVLIYAVSWFGAMVWWLRRKSRVMENPLGLANPQELPETGRTDRSGE